MKKFPQIKLPARKKKKKLRILEEMKFRSSEISAASVFVDEVGGGKNLSPSEIAKANYSKKEIELQTYKIKALLEKIRAISPEIMTNETIKAIEDHPKSKIISKYYQIHDPYLYYSGDLPPKRKKIPPPG